MDVGFRCKDGSMQWVTNLNEIYVQTSNATREYCLSEDGNELIADFVTHPIRFREPKPEPRYEIGVGV